MKKDNTFYVKIILIILVILVIIVIVNVIPLLLGNYIIVVLSPFFLAGLFLLTNIKLANNIFRLSENLYSLKNDLKSFKKRFFSILDYLVNSLILISFLSILMFPLSLLRFINSSDSIMFFAIIINYSFWRVLFSLFLSTPFIESFFREQVAYPEFPQNTVKLILEVLRIILLPIVVLNETGKISSNIFNIKILTHSLVGTILIDSIINYFINHKKKIKEKNDKIKERNEINKRFDILQTEILSIKHITHSY